MMKKLVFAAVVSLSIVISLTTTQRGETKSVSDQDNNDSAFRYDFYRDSCPDAEKIVWSAMQRIMLLNDNAHAQLLRLLFHDCFIEGCDASVLLEASNSSDDAVERQAIPNQTLKGFPFIDMIKEELERACPGTVSCSDILVLATRDGIAMSGGPYYPVFTGRRDSNASFFSTAMAEIPRPDGNISETLRLFSLKGFNERETVSLLGAHNIGKIGCEFIQPRFDNFMGTGLPDPTISPDFLEEMRFNCREDPNSINNSVPSFRFRSLSQAAAKGMAMTYMQGLSSSIPSGTTFGTRYYKSLVQGRGILYADQQLMVNEETTKAVIDYSSDDGTKFRTDFARVMIKMSNLGVLTGLDGQVRRECSKVETSA